MPVELIENVIISDVIYPDLVVVVVFFFLFTL
jgi:hypothetical protein